MAVAVGSAWRVAAAATDVASTSASRVAWAFSAAAASAVRRISTSSAVRVASVPAVTEVYEEYRPYLPWGAFFGAFVRKETPAEALDVLRSAFTKAFQDPRFDEFAKTMGGVKLGITGDEAKKYIRQNQSVAAWLLYDAGGAKFSPEEFGIERPQGK